MTASGSLSAEPNPIQVPGHAVVGATVLSWNAPEVEAVEIRVGAPDGPLFLRGERTGNAATGEWVSDGMVFYLQDASPGRPLTEVHTIATTAVGVATPGPALGAILTYHRVAELSRDPWGLAVSPRHFGEHLQAIQTLATPWRLTDFARSARRGQRIERAAVVTFDDGYADNLHSAKPWLERYGMPATVFITAGFVGGQREFWWDALDCLLADAPLPEVLSLTIDGQTLHWNLGEMDDRAKLPAAGRTSLQAARQRVYGELYQLLRPLPDDKQRPAVDQLWAWAGIHPTSRTDHRQLSVPELRALAAGGLIEIGSHTVTHPHLPSLPSRLQWEEIAHSKLALERLLGGPLASLSYPHGASTPETRALVEQAGYSCACSSTPRAVGPGADPYRLPRVMVEDWDGAEFAQRLTRLLGP